MKDAKAFLRKIILEKRKLLEQDIRNRRNVMILGRLMDVLFERKPRTIHTYLPIRKNNEIDTWSLISNYQDFQWVLSRTNFKEKTMSHLLYSEHVEILENSLGIPEPIRGIEISPKEMDCVIVPLLAFDKAGRRLGYGGGYYDRFLSQTNEGTLKIGLSFTAALDEFSFMEPHDISLDIGITPWQTLVFNEKI